MESFSDINDKYNTEFTNRLFENKHIFYEIYEACGNKFSSPCGSYLFDGQTYKYCDLMYKKQELLYESVKNVSTVLEIGVYMGHSILIMLLSNPDLKITCIDIDDTFALPAVTVLNRYFDNAITFIHSDSLEALTTLSNNKSVFDFFHVDGFHENDYIRNEFLMLINIKKNNPADNIFRVLFDDADCLQELQINIWLSLNVIKIIRPSCPWRNVYFEIQL